MVQHRQVSAGFPLRLRNARTRAGLTTDELARAVGFKTRASVSNLELGKQSATLELAENLARLLDVRPCWLAYGEGTGPGASDVPAAPAEAPQTAVARAGPGDCKDSSRIMVVVSQWGPAQEPSSKRHEALSKLLQNSEGPSFVLVLDGWDELPAAGSARAAAARDPAPGARWVGEVQTFRSFGGKAPRAEAPPSTEELARLAEELRRGLEVVERQRTAAAQAGVGAVGRAPPKAGPSRKRRGAARA